MSWSSVDVHCTFVAIRICEKFIEKSLRSSPYQRNGRTFLFFARAKSGPGFVRKVFDACMNGNALHYNSYVPCNPTWHDLIITVSRFITRCRSVLCSAAVLVGQRGRRPAGPRRLSGPRHSHTAGGAHRQTRDRRQLRLHLQVSRSRDTYGQVDASD